MFPEHYCSCRITRDILQDFEAVVIPLNDIPAEGICSVSPSRKEPCQYPLSPENCPRRRFGDFCNMPWAINPEAFEASRGVSA